MRHLFYSFILCMCMFSFTIIKKNRWLYEADPITEVSESEFIVKVSSYFKRPHIEEEVSKKNAIHAIIFKGVQGHPPLTKDPSTEELHIEFFDSFFKDGGEYSNFVFEVTDGSIAMNDIVKTKEGYRIGQFLRINHHELRRYLEEHGVIKKLTNAFQ